MYDTTEEARQKLGNSTVLYEGIPVQILDASGSKGKIGLTFHRLPLNDANHEPERFTRSIEDKAWDFRSLSSKLGYVNRDKSQFSRFKEAVFVSRVPSRASRQGLDGRVVSIKPFFQGASKGSACDWAHLFYDEGLLRTVRNEFPKAHEAVKALFDNPKDVISIAISRKLMLAYDQVTPPVLVYRNEKIGYTEDGVTFKLARHKKHLTESLTDEEGLKIAG